MRCRGLVPWSLTLAAVAANVNPPGARPWHLRAAELNSQRPFVCHTPACFELEVSGLRESHASGGVGDRVRVTCRWMDSSRAAHLRGEEAIRGRPERLPR